VTAERCLEEGAGLGLGDAAGALVRARNVVASEVCNPIEIPDEFSRTLLKSLMSFQGPPLKSLSAPPPLLLLPL
jgi:hypothetical protein